MVEDLNFKGMAGLPSRFTMPVGLLLSLRLRTKLKMLGAL